MDEHLKNLLGFDPEKLAGDADRLFGQMRDMHQAGTAVSARAESDDGRVAVEYSAAQGLSALEIDPRAMRLGSQELAETIMRLVRQARSEVETRGREQVAAFLTADSSLISGRDTIGEHLQNAQGAIDDNLRGAMEMLDRLQARMRR